MQMPGLSYSNVHDFCINAVQSVADTFRWELGYGKLKEEDIALLESGAYGQLPWRWAIENYGNPLKDGVLDLSMRIKELDSPYPGAVALCRIDDYKERLEICMMENFLKAQQTPLTGKVWLSTLIFAHTVAKATKHEDIYVMNPYQRYLKMYRSFGFYEDAMCMPHLCATVDEVEIAIQSALK